MSYVLFFLAGLGFGYAAPGKARLLPLLFPLALALIAIANNGLDGETVLKLVIALVVMLIGIALGGMLEERAQRGGAARTT
jgi:hypothetical protein